MGSTRRRKLRPPVIGRLTLAWSAFGALATGLAAYAAIWGANALRPERVALPIGSDIETMARPEAPPPRTASVLASGATGERLAPGSLEPRDDRLTEEPYSDVAEDELGDAYASFEERLAVPADDIIITVDGAPARRANAGALAPQLASLQRRGSAILIPNAKPEFLQATPLGMIPKIGADGRRPADLYARPFRDEGGRPKAGVIVSGLGLDPTLTARAIEELPPEVTLSFAPYARDLDRWTEMARAAGHEILVELPMETYAGRVETLGPAALLTTRTEAENLQRLDWLLSRFGAYVGATNYLGAKLSADKSAIGPVIARLDSLGLAYFDDTGAAKAAAASPGAVARIDAMIVPPAGADDPEAVRRDLDLLARSAAARGEALAKTYASRAAIEAIKDWSAELEDAGVALAPASAILRARAGRG